MNKITNKKTSNYQNMIEIKSDGLENKKINKDITRILPICCLALVASFFHDVNEITSFLSCNKITMMSVQMSNPILFVNNKEMNHELVNFLIKYVPRLEGLIFKSFKKHKNSNILSKTPTSYKYPALYSSLSLNGVNTNICSFFELRNEFIKKKKFYKNEFTLSVSKTIDWNSEARKLLNICISDCKHASLCDINFIEKSSQNEIINPIIHNPNVSQLESLILVNSSIIDCTNPNSFIITIEIVNHNIYNNNNNNNGIKFLSLGGYKGLKEYIGILSKQYYIIKPQLSIENYINSYISKLFPSLYKYAVIDVTFQSSRVIKLLKLYYSECIFIDLENDNINYLELQLQSVNITAKMRQTLTLASNEINFGQTLLHRSCTLKDVERVEWLLNKMNARVDVKDLKGCNPLHRAVQSNDGKNNDCVRLLINTKPHINGSITESCCDRNQAAETPVYIAALKGDYNSMNEILLNKDFQFPWQLFQSTAGLGNLNLHNLERIEKLKSSKIQLENNLFTATTLDIVSSDDRGFSPLHVAVLCNSIKVVKLLLERLLDSKNDNNNYLWSPNYPNVHLQTPLHLAYEQGNEEIIELLIESGANQDIKDLEGRIPIYYKDRTKKQIKYKTYKK